ncbi:MAG: chromate transporter [Clostridia bacterium]|nr:chromate transporter [Clostridia bacterium]
MLDLIAIAQSAPGAVAINTSALVGKRLGGALGVFAALLGAVLPPFIIISVISFFYALFIENRIVANVLLGMRAGVTAVIADAVITMAAPFVKNKKIVSVLLVAAAFVSIFFFGVNPVFVILGGILTGIVLMLITKGRRKEK